MIGKAREYSLTKFFLVVYSILIFLPELLLIDAPGIRGYFASLGFNYLFALAISLMICIPGELLKCLSRRLYFGYHLIIHFLVVSFSASELFLISVFNLQWNAFTFQLLNETTIQETTGFFKTYGGTWQFATIGIGLVLFASFEILSIYRLRKSLIKSNKTIAKLVRIVVVCSIVFFLAEARCFTTNPNTNYNRSDRLIRRDGLWNLYQSVLMYNEDKEAMFICIESQRDLRIHDCHYGSRNIVLVIGESFNKHHSSLYGYNLATNPQCELLNPIVFDDVITSSNATTTSFKYFMSFANTGDTIRWCDTPMFPALFKSVGYNVVFYSNQYVTEGNLDYYDASAGFFNHPSIYSQLFAHRNHRLYDFDMDMLEEYRQQRSQLEDSLNLIIFHLHGQHSPAVERYPSGYGTISCSDYSNSELTPEQLQYICDYDNATLYNDAVVSEVVRMYEKKDAIVIYFADHGEEVYDCRNKAGRFFDFETPDVARNQLDIPFFVFASQQYKELHPEIVDAIESAKHRPFMTDELPHLMLWLAGIESDWYDETKNLFSAKYNCSRKRLIAGTTIDYNNFVSNDTDDLE